MNAGSDIQVQSTTVNRQWVLAERPVDRAVRETDFRLVESPLPVPGDGEFLVRTLYLSLAPVMRLYMLDGAGIERPLGIGEVMRGRGVGQVIASNHPDFHVGDHVQQAKLCAHTLGQADRFVKTTLGRFAAVNRDKDFSVHGAGPSRLPGGCVDGAAAVLAPA